MYGAKVPPLNTLTVDPPPGPGAVMISAIPSPLRSVDATRTPAENPAGYARNAASGVSVWTS